MKVTSSTGNVVKYNPLKTRKGKNKEERIPISAPSLEAFRLFVRPLFPLLRTPPWTKTR